MCTAQKQGLDPQTSASSLQHELLVLLPFVQVASLQTGMSLLKAALFAQGHLATKVAWPFMYATAYVQVDWGSPLPIVQTASP